MKYRVKSITLRQQIIKNGSFKACRKNKIFPVVLPPAARERAEEINFNTLFELGELPSPKKKPKKRRAPLHVKAFFAALGTAILKIIAYPFRRVRDKNRRLAFYSGLLCASALVALASLISVLALLFGTYFAPYDELAVPYVVGEELSLVEETVDERYELLISYKNSDSIPAGVIISQTPDGGVTRKIYKNKAPRTLTLTVSMGKSFYTVESLAGTNARDSLLRLRNSGVAVNAVYEYSDSVPTNTVISTSPPTGERIYEGDELTVRISLGKKINTVSVPDLRGLNEAAARSLLKDNGLVLGSITYRQSSIAAGKIISQSYSPYASLPEGSSVDITVSLGNEVTEKRVPNLYGLTVSEAAQKLAEVGLVVGNVYTVSSGAPTGTVITQTPIAETPITSSLTSVDLYISS